MKKLNFCAIKNMILKTLGTISLIYIVPVLYWNFCIYLTNNYEFFQSYGEPATIETAFFIPIALMLLTCIGFLFHLIYFVTRNLIKDWYIHESNKCKVKK